MMLNKAQQNNKAKKSERSERNAAFLFALNLCLFAGHVTEHVFVDSVNSEFQWFVGFVKNRAGIGVVEQWQEPMYSLYISEVKYNRYIVFICF